MSEKIKPREIRDMNIAEIRKTIMEQEMELMREETVGLTVQKSGSMNSENTCRRRELRRNIARLKTILNEKKRSGE